MNRLNCSSVVVGTLKDREFGYRQGSGDPALNVGHG